MLEEKRICAFIDILGFKNEILNSDDERRAKIISLIEEFTLEDSQQGMNSQNLGLGIISHPSAEVTSFSDNIVISSNLKDYTRKIKYGNKIEEIKESPIKFVEHIFIKIISVYWRALHLGLLFRGGITIGKLYHKNRVVVGEALVNSYELETKTSMPRIEVSKEVIDTLKGLYSKQPEPMNNISSIILQKDGKYYVNIFCFHMGVWWDYQHINGIKQLEYTEIINIVDSILVMADTNYKKHIKEDNLKIALKWEWFINTMKEEFNKGHWKLIKDNIKKK